MTDYNGISIRIEAQSDYGSYFDAIVITQGLTLQTRLHGVEEIREAVSELSKAGIGYVELHGARDFSWSHDGKVPPEVLPLILQLGGFQSPAEVEDA